MSDLWTALGRCSSSSVPLQGTEHDHQSCKCYPNPKSALDFCDSYRFWFILPACWTGQNQFILNKARAKCLQVSYEYKKLYENIYWPIFFWTFTFLLSVRCSCIALFKSFTTLNQYLNHARTKEKSILGFIATLRSKTLAHLVQEYRA